jgi:hypothetical protein
MKLAEAVDRAGHITAYTGTSAEPCFQKRKRSTELRTSVLDCIQRPAALAVRDPSAGRLVPMPSADYTRALNYVHDSKKSETKSQ